MHRQRGWQAHFREGGGSLWAQAVISEQLLVESFPGNEGRIAPAGANARGWIAGFSACNSCVLREDDEN